MIQSIPGPEGRLQVLFHEARGLEEGQPPRAVAVVCHPHPAHGGNMDSTVTFKTARALQEAGVACLRINFRGVGQSDGRYDGNGAEEHDARAALDWLVERYPDAPVWAAGFSFGSRTVFGLALRDDSIQRLILVGFPVRTYSLKGVNELPIPTLFVWGSKDEYGTQTDLVEQYPVLPAHFEFVQIEGADHFFRRFTKELENHVRDYAERGLRLGG